MKTSRVIIISMLALVIMSFDPDKGALTNAERKYAIDLLKGSKENVLKQTKGLTPEQLNFKPDADTWSIAECTEHIAISENNFHGFMQMALKTAADPSKRTEVKMTDEQIVAMMTDRSKKVKTSETFQPSGKYGSFEATIKEFISQRDGHIRYMKTTSDDMRNHYNDFPFGKLDTYQTMLFMAAHSKRHTDQIAEILQHPDFPKKTAQ